MNSVKMELIRNLVENLTVLRAKACLTQEELGEIVGLSRQSVAMIENKNRKLSWTNALAIVYVFTFNPETADMLKKFNIVSNDMILMMKNYCGGK